MRYKMEDGVVVDTRKAVASWEEARLFDGQNMLSVATGSQWHHQRLYKSSKGRYYIEAWSDWQGNRPSASWISNREAAAWLAANDRELPPDLLQEDVTE